MLADLDRKINRLRRLKRTQATVKSQGRYPKTETPVADVCRYQNDGTDRVTPSKFIERAEAEADAWHDDIEKAITAYLNGAGESALQEAVDKIAADISRVCDRIRTGQLKASFEGKLESK